MSDGGVKWSEDEVKEVACIVYCFPKSFIPSLLHGEKLRDVTMYYQICQYYVDAHSVLWGKLFERCEAVFSKVMKRLFSKDVKRLSCGSAGVQ